MRNAQMRNPRRPVPAGITQVIYDSELSRLFAKAVAKGPDCLTTILLEETEAARATLGEWAVLPKADAVLDAVRAHLTGTGSSTDCEKCGSALSRELQLMPPPFSDTGRALRAYQNACAVLPITEISYRGGHEDACCNVASWLVDFAAQREARPEREMRSEQLKRLQSALAGISQGTQQFARDRVSLLAR